MFPGISWGRAAPREATESHSPPARGFFFAARIWQEESCAASPVACPAASLCCTQPWCISPAQAASWTRGDELRAGLIGLKQSSASTAGSAPAVLPGPSSWQPPAPPAGLQTSRLVPGQALPAATRRFGFWYNADGDVTKRTVSRCRGSRATCPRAGWWCCDKGGSGGPAGFGRSDAKREGCSRCQAAGEHGQRRGEGERGVGSK